MVIGKIKPAATVVTQFAAGVEIDAIQHEGKLYLPVVGMGEFAPKEVAPKPATAPAKSETSAPAASEVADEKEDKKSYTEDELMEMSTKELLKICKNEFGINPDDFDGKNTNKKLRNLILDAQENGGSDSEKDEDEDDAPAPKKGGKKSAPKEEEEEDEDSNDEESDDSGNDLVNQVGDILEDFDAGKKNKKKTLSAILALSEDADEDKVGELVDKFESDEDADIDELAEEIVKALTAPKEEKPAKKGKRSPKKSKEELVDVDDLEVGDRVSVWWDDDNQEWFDGSVKSKKKGKVVIAYDDDTEEAIDPEVHTKIKKLAE